MKDYQGHTKYGFPSGEENQTFCPANRINQLEAELAEANTKLALAYHDIGCWRNDLSGCDVKLRESETKLAEFKRQIAAGELVTIKFLMEHYTKYCGESEAKHHVVIMQKLSVDQAGKDAL